MLLQIDDSSFFTLAKMAVLFIVWFQAEGADELDAWVSILPFHCRAISITAF